jgi:hypothetical protein
MNRTWIADPPRVDRPTTTDPLRLPCDRCPSIAVLHRHHGQWLCEPCRDGAATADAQDRRQDRLLRLRGRR